MKAMTIKGQARNRRRRKRRRRRRRAKTSCRLEMSRSASVRIYLLFIKQVLDLRRLWSSSSIRSNLNSSVNSIGDRFPDPKPPTPPFPTINRICFSSALGSKGSYFTLARLRQCFDPANAQSKKRLAKLQERNLFLPTYTLLGIRRRGRTL